jgi:1-acyl-sn-glycerol-3-phosphate acyltransferase
MVGTKTLLMNLGVSYRVAEVILWPPFMVMTRRDWRGTQNLGKHGEGIVVAPNHISFLDPLLLAHFLHDNGRPPRFMGKQSVFEVPLAGQLIRGAGQIPVSRDKDPHKALAAAVAAVRAGECVVMYPEGTITRDPDIWPMSGKTGALRVALETDAPLIPIAQWGANKIMPPYTTQMNVLPPKTMQITAGPALDIDDLRGRRITKALLEEGTDRLMDAITGLLEEIRGERAPEQRLDWAAQQKLRAAVQNEEEI